MSNNLLIKSLKELCLLLEEQGMQYMLVGGLAVGIWAEPRATVDIDFLVSTPLNDFDLLRRKVNESGRFVFIHEKPMIFGKVSFLRATLKRNTDISVDFLFADDDFKKEALRRKQTVNIDDFFINISTPEDLIILKLLSGREQDRLDANKIIKIQKEYLNKEYIQKWAEKLDIQWERR